MEKQACGILVLAVAVLGMPVKAAPPQLLWGDTHVHTTYSADAFTMGNRSATPEVAYRFARGEPVVHPMHKARMQIDTPLDFIVVADHAENLGVLSEIYFNGVQLENPGLIERLKGWFTERSIRNMLDSGDFDAAIKEMASTSKNPSAAARDMMEADKSPIINAAALEAKAWGEIIRLADEYYEPGDFTTLIGWEWSSAPGGANLHRVVMSDADSDVAAQFQPFGADDSPYPEDLWAWLERTADETGADFVAIPHNSNISKGFMFAESSLRGEEITEDYARLRLRWEPVVEVTQIKGDSETHRALSPRDEFADFETYSFTFDVQQGPPRFEPQTGDYARPALLRGLELESRLGVNPYRFGLIGSTDSHTGLATAEEDNFGGKFALDSTPESKGPPDNVEGVSGWSMSAQGLAAVWAQENTREAILDAFKRREVYATTGPRITLQFFGGWDYREKDLEGADSLSSLREKGAPMGGKLKASGTISSAPSFVVRALRDPSEGNLDRIQIIKGWLDQEGEPREKIYNVAWSGERRLRADGRLPAVGNTVDLRTGRYSNSIGASSLAAVWTDPDFDPRQKAFYYTRVLQIPTPRHLLLDALALGRKAPPQGSAVIQERAYSSPIWYAPESGTAE